MQPPSPTLLKLMGYQERQPCFATSPWSPARHEPLLGEALQESRDVLLSSNGWRKGGKCLRSVLKSKHAHERSPLKSMVSCKTLSASLTCECCLYLNYNASAPSLSNTPDKVASQTNKVTRVTTHHGETALHEQL